MTLHIAFGTQSNAGDAASRPGNYFQIPEKPDWKIIGGGAIEHYVSGVPAMERAKTVVWGVGAASVQAVPEWARSEFAAYGCRDWPLGIGSPTVRWVPCASCMHPGFDTYRVQVPTEPVVWYYNHAKDRVPVLEHNFPSMDNSSSIEDALIFLSQAFVVLTNSYHGAYWASLLNRSAMVLNPYNAKFYGFKYPPNLWEAANINGTPPDTIRNIVLDRVDLPNSRALADCRSANREFYAKVLEVMQ